MSARFQGPLVLNQAAAKGVKHIKDLQTLGCAAMQDVIDIKVLQTLGMARETRDLSPCAENARNPETSGCLLRRPVHGEGQALALR